MLSTPEGQQFVAAASRDQIADFAKEIEAEMTKASPDRYAPEYAVPETLQATVPAATTAQAWGAPVQQKRAQYTSVPVLDPHSELVMDSFSKLTDEELEDMPSTDLLMMRESFPIEVVHPDLYARLEKSAKGELV